MNGLEDKNNKKNKQNQGLEQGNHPHSLTQDLDLGEENLDMGKELGRIGKNFSGFSREKAVSISLTFEKVLI